MLHLNIINYFSDSSNKAIIEELKDLGLNMNYLGQKIEENADYDAFFDGKKNSLIWDPLKLAMLSTHVVFVGYSLDDSNIFGILRKIENLCNGSTKEMYLISPSTEDYKADRLRKHNVKWIQSTAETFLKELELNIKDNIFDDYRKKAVSPRTFIEFCHIHDINPDIRENEQSNEVVRLQGYAGKSLNRQISVKATYNPLAIWPSAYPFARCLTMQG